MYARVKKWLKKGYYGNECWSLAWDRVRDVSKVEFLSDFESKKQFFFLQKESFKTERYHRKMYGLFP